MKKTLLARSFCASFPWAAPFEFFDRQGVARLDGVRRAVLSLSTAGRCADHYVGFDASIVSKTAGEIAGNFFAFDDYMVERVDDRPDYRDGFKVIAYCGWDWYIAVPADADLARYARAVEAWIELWK